MIHSHTRGDGKFISDTLFLLDRSAHICAPLVDSTATSIRSGPRDRVHFPWSFTLLYKSQMSLPQGPSHGSPQRAWTHRYDNAHNMSVDSLPLASPHAIWRCSRTGTRDSGPGMHKCKQSFLPVELLPMCASGLRYRGLTSSTLVGSKMDLAIASNVWN